MESTFLFLGTGGSLGVPVVGCSCPICLSHDKKNKRLRSSALITTGNKKFLIDCGPDFRQQALTQGINSIDGCLITHIHHDHTASIDELRVFTFTKKKALPCLMSPETASDIRRRFDYLFLESEREKRSLSILDIHELPKKSGKINFEGVEVIYVGYEQSGTSVTGYRFGDLSYISDIKIYDEDIFDFLKGTKILIVSALRFTHSNLHFSVDEAIDFSKKIGASKTYLTHLSHELDFEKTSAYLPDNVHLGYDGLSFNF